MARKGSSVHREEPSAPRTHPSSSRAATSTALVSYLSTPGFCSLCVPRPYPSSLLEECSSWSPFRLSFLKLHLPVECEDWPLEPSLLDAPAPPASLLESSTWHGWLWDQPIFERCLAGGSLNPESLSNHLQPLAIARAA